jgi:plastocyanin
MGTARCAAMSRKTCAWAGGLFAAVAAGAAWATTLDVRVTDAQGRALSEAVVFLESASARAAVRPARVEISQANRAFDPVVSVVPLGSSVHFPNRDTVRHSVYSFSPTKRFELKLYVGTPAEPVVFDQPGIAVLGCNIHDQMAAWVVVVPTPWFGKAGADGVVRLAGVPPGRYRLRTWHVGLPVGAPAADQPLQMESSAQSLQVRLQEARP